MKNLTTLVSSVRLFQRSLIARIDTAFFMHTAQVQKDSKSIIQSISLNWTDNRSVQELLDVVVSIIAEEYIQIAKQNPDIFSENGGKR